MLAALSRLRQDCTAAKELLSIDTEATITVQAAGRRTRIRLVRSEFEELIRDAIEDTVDATRRAINSAGLALQDIDAIVLVGGSSRIPLVAQLISAEFSLPIVVDASPEASTSLGAAWFARAACRTKSAPRRTPRAAGDCRTAVELVAGPPAVAGARAAGAPHRSSCRPRTPSRAAAGSTRSAARRATAGGTASRRHAPAPAPLRQCQAGASSARRPAARLERRSPSSKGDQALLDRTWRGSSPPAPRSSLRDRRWRHPRPATGTRRRQSAGERPSNSATPTGREPYRHRASRSRTAGSILTWSTPCTRGLVTCRVSLAGRAGNRVVGDGVPVPPRERSPRPLPTWWPESARRSRCCSGFVTTAARTWLSVCSAPVGAASPPCWRPAGAVRGGRRPGGRAGCRTRRQPCRPARPSILDDVHLLPADVLQRVSDWSDGPGARWWWPFGPWPRPPALTALASLIRRRGPLTVLKHLDRAEVAAAGRGRARRNRSHRSLLDLLVEQSAGQPMVLDEALATLLELGLRPGLVGGPPGQGGDRSAAVRRRRPGRHRPAPCCGASRPARISRSGCCPSCSSSIAAPVREAVETARASGLLLGDGRMIPLFRAALLGAEPVEGTRDLQVRLLEIHAGRGHDVVPVARVLARSGMRNQRAAALLVAAGDARLHRSRRSPRRSMPTRFGPARRRPISRSVAPRRRCPRGVRRGAATGGPGHRRRRLRRRRAGHRRGRHGDGASRAVRPRRRPVPLAGPGPDRRRGADGRAWPSSRSASRRRREPFCDTSARGSRRPCWPAPWPRSVRACSPR